MFFDKYVFLVHLLLKSPLMLFMNENSTFLDVILYVFRNLVADA